MEDKELPSRPELILHGAGSYAHWYRSNTAFPLGKDLLSFLETNSIIEVSDLNLTPTGDRCSPISCFRCCMLCRVQVTTNASSLHYTAVQQIPPGEEQSVTSQQCP
jgi:hypothetical protein